MRAGGGRHPQWIGGVAAAVSIVLLFVLARGLAVIERERFADFLNRESGLIAGMVPISSRDPAAAEALARRIRDLHRRHGTHVSVSFPAGPPAPLRGEAAWRQTDGSPARAAAGPPLGVVTRFLPQHRIEVVRSFGTSSRRGILRIEATPHLASAVRRDMAVLAPPVLACLGIILLCGGVWFRRRYVRPLDRLTNSVRALTRGGGEMCMGGVGTSPPAVLAAALDEMAAEMRRRIDEARSRRSRLEAVFSSMAEGVLVVDGDGEVRLVNPALRAMLAVEGDPVGRRPLEVIRHVGVQEIVDQVLRSRKTETARTLHILGPEERFIDVHAAPVTGGRGRGGAVLVFHDVTELHRLERIRRDFVANVTHELRTPIATIKGYTETLIDGAIEDRDTAEEFLRTIAVEAERLAALVEDILELARLDGGGSETSVRRPCRIEEVCDEALIALAPLARRRGVSVVKEFSPVLRPVVADADALSRVFFNLVENAVKYNRPGGRVVVSAEERSGEVVIRVRDTGIGIPEPEWPRIFERFYRVDKGRSRETGGTGLGLAIVKHIVQTHGGRVEVESAVGEGSEFRVILP